MSGWHLKHVLRFFYKAPTLRHCRNLIMNAANVRKRYYLNIARKFHSLLYGHNHWLRLVGGVLLYNRVQSLDEGRLMQYKLFPNRVPRRTDAQLFRHYWQRQRRSHRPSRKFMRQLAHDYYVAKKYGLDGNGTGDEHLYRPTPVPVSGAGVKVASAWGD